MHAKPNLPEKTCAVCKRPFAWRRKWAKVWERSNGARTVADPGVAGLGLFVGQRNVLGRCQLDKCVFKSDRAVAAVRRKGGYLCVGRFVCSQSAL